MNIWERIRTDLEAAIFFFRDTKDVKSQGYGSGSHIQLGVVAPWWQENFWGSARD